MTHHHPSHQSGSSGYQGAPQYVRPPAYDRSAYYTPGSSYGPSAPANGTPPYPSAGGPNGSWPAQGPVKGSPPLWVGILALALSPVLAVGGIILSLVFGSQELDRELAAAQPGVTEELDASTMHTLYAPAGESVVASDCQVYGPEYDPIYVSDSYSTSTEERAGESYQEIGEFTTTDAGRYRVSCEGSSDLLAIEGNGYVWIGLGSLFSVLGAGVLGVLGVVLIVVNRISASRRRQSAWGGRY